MEENEIGIKTKLPALLACCLLLLACADEPKLSPLPANAVILAFGDSLTNGNGARREESYPAVLETLSARPVINAGVSGEVSAAGLERLPGLLSKHQPKLVLLCHGGNDFLRKLNLGKLEANVTEMIRLAREAGAEVVLLGVPRPGLFLSSADLYAKVAASTGVVFIESLVADVLGDNSLKSDAVHPNKRGYRRMAETIYDNLKSAGAL